MKTLVIYYSRTGTTKKVGEEIARRLGGDTEEVTDVQKLTGFVGWLKCGRNSTRKFTTPINPIRKDPAAYDLVIVGTPVWAWTVSSPVRTLLTETKGKFRKCAFFCTMGGSGGEGAISEMEEVSGLKPVATLILRTNDVKRGSADAAIEQFARQASGQ